MQSLAGHTEMQQQQTTLYDLVKHIRLAKPKGTVYMGMYRSNARFAVPDGGALIYGYLGQFGRSFTVIQTRHEDVDGVRVPRELIYFCLSLAESREVAAPYLYQTAAHVHSICCLSANAGSTVIQETLFTEFPFAEWRRFTRQFPFSEIPTYPLGGRFVAREETLRLAGKIWEHAHRERLLLAISQYEEALRLWRPGSAPLLCLHLWMAAESITEVVLEKILAEKGCAIDELADFYKIPHTQQSKCKACGHEHEQIVVCPACSAVQPPTKNDRKYHVRARVRREVIFQGDKTTYDTIRNTSDGIEHGAGTFADIWNVDFGIYEKTAKYLRQAIFNIVELETAERDVLDAAPFEAVYLAPRPPEKQDFSKPIMSYDITTPKQDWYAFFTPKIVAVEISEDKRGFLLRYEGE